MDPHQSSLPLARRVLDRINTEHLTPRPRWEFLFKNYFFWTLGAVAVALGALAFSAALFRVENASWGLYFATHKTFLSFFVDAAPFLWLLMLMLFIGVGYINIRHTKRGYRYPLALIALGAVLTSAALGTGLYMAGFGGEIEEAIGSYPPIYRPILRQERNWWMAPAQGLLGGQILSVSPAAATTSALTFVIRDFAGHEWTINGIDLRGRDLNALVPGGVVRIVGVPVSLSATTTVFHACFVFPWTALDKDQLPPPDLHETGPTAARSALCKGIRPYKQLHTLDENGL